MRKLLFRSTALFSATFAGLIVAGQSVLAAGPAIPCTLPSTGSLLGLPHWWEYLNGDLVGGSCTPYVSWPAGIWPIGLAILDMLLRVAGIAAVISIIVSSVMYITSAGAPDRTSAALNRIINSLIGLAIVLVAAGVVSFIGHKLAGS